MRTFNHHHHHFTSPILGSSWFRPRGPPQACEGGSSANEIIDGFLYISDITFIQSATLALHGISAVISVTPRDPLTPLDPKILRLAIRIADNSQTAIYPHFAACNEFMERARMDNKKVVVHCEAGISRSSAVVIAYLMRYRAMSLRDAYNLLKSRRPIIRPNRGFMQQLLEYEKSIFGASDFLFLAEYLKEVYNMENTPEAILKILEKHNMDIGATLMSLFPV